VTATGLSTWFAEIFWKYQLPQVAHTEPSIRHALLAISAAHEALEVQRLISLYDPEIECPSVTRKPFACGHYGTAVGHLSRVLANGQASEEITMMASSLFVILKFMWGYFGEAMVHLHDDVEILMRGRNGRASPTVLKTWRGVWSIISRPSSKGIVSRAWGLKTR